MQQKQRLAVITALPYCEENTWRFHDEVIHQEAGLLSSYYDLVLLLIVRFRSKMQVVGARVDGHTLLFDVWVVANSTRALLDDALRPSGLSAEEFALYSALRRDGGVTPTELAALMAFPSTTVSSIVARLERRGHVRRARNPDDARSYRIQLTPAGRATHSAAAKLFAPVLAGVKATLTLPIAEALAVLAAINSAVRIAKPDR